MFSPFEWGRIPQTWLGSMSGVATLPLRIVPGYWQVVALILVFAAASVVVVIQRVRFRGHGRFSSVLSAVIELPTAPLRERRYVFLAVLAVSAPLGVIVYSLLETSLLLPRNLAVSAPAAWLLLGAGIGGLVRPVRWLLAAAAIVALLLGATKMLGPQARRPPLDEVAAYIRTHAVPGARVIELGPAAPGPLQHDMLASTGAARLSYVNSAAAASTAALWDAPQLFVINRVWKNGLPPAKPPSVPVGFAATSDRLFDGSTALRVTAYRRQAKGAR
jgi:hypothetical protein